MTESRPSDSDYDMPIIMHPNGTVMGEKASDVRQAVALGLLALCRHGREQKHLPDEDWPCGYSHAGPGFFHPAEGHEVEDYLKASE